MACLTELGMSSLRFLRARRVVDWMTRSASRTSCRWRRTSSRACLHREQASKVEPDLGLSSQVPGDHVRLGWRSCPDFTGSAAAYSQRRGHSGDAGGQVSKMRVLFRVQGPTLTPAIDFDRSKAFDEPAEAHPAVPPKASQDSSVSLPDAVQPPLTADPEPASEKATTFNSPLAAAPVPAPTMFHFVSPFDAFGPTPKRSRSAAPPSPQVVDQQQPTPIARSASSWKLFSPDAPVPSPLAQEISARAPVSSSVAAPQPAIQTPESMPEAVRIPPPELARSGSVNSNSAIASPDLPSYKGRSDSFTSTRLGHTRSASGNLRVSKGDIVIGGTLRPRKLEEEEKKRNKGVSHAG